MRQIVCESCGLEIPRQRLPDGSLLEIPELQAILTVMRGPGEPPMIVKLMEDVCSSCGPKLADAIQAILPRRA